jgi:hypothetical protein
VLILSKLERASPLLDRIEGNDVRTVIVEYASRLPAS